MRLSYGVNQSYRNAAKPFRQNGEYTERVGKCLELVKKLSSGDVEEYDGLVMPLVGNQPRALLGMLASSEVIRVLLPVCPPAPKSPKTFRPAVTAEAAAGIRAARVLSTSFADAIGVDVRPVVMVADTETDLEAVMERAGGLQRYVDVCSESSVLIGGQLNTGEVTTFRRFFDLGFHALQYAAESEIRQMAGLNPKLDRIIGKVSSERAAKHETILGRPERDNELAVRYAAQYMALGGYIRSDSQNTVVCNYPTPNLAFYNMRSDEDVAVFESRLERSGNEER